MSRSKWLYLLFAVVPIGCEQIVGIEDLTHVEKKADGGTGDDDDDAATADHDAATCDDTDIVICTGGTAPKGQICNDQAGVSCTCAGGLICAFGTLAGVRIGHCCPSGMACGVTGDTCEEACNCKSGTCQTGHCR